MSAGSATTFTSCSPNHADDWFDDWHSTSSLSSSASGLLWHSCCCTTVCTSRCFPSKTKYVNNFYFCVGIFLYIALIVRYSYCPFHQLCLSINIYFMAALLIGSTSGVWYLYSSHTHPLVLSFLLSFTSGWFCSFVSTPVFLWLCQLIELDTLISSTLIVIGYRLYCILSLAISFLALRNYSDLSANCMNLIFNFILFIRVEICGAEI